MLERKARGLTIEQRQGMDWAARLAVLAEIDEDRLVGDVAGRDRDDDPHLHGPVLEAVMSDFDRAVKRALMKLKRIFLAALKGVA